MKVFIITFFLLLISLMLYVPFGHELFDHSIFSMFLLTYVRVGPVMAQMLKKQVGSWQEKMYGIDRRELALPSTSTAGT